ncbi:MAG TPA: enoyl-CoA hydratase-related protein [Acidimicrobiales bacterium]|nr:enoyl-CoA hydratase-related protein [Acidimicrobiales bacterium]
MPEPHLLVEIEDGVAVLTMNRPEKRNALSPEMVVRMASAWHAVRDDPAIRVAVLTGTGDRAFCSGADLGRLIPLMTRQRPAEDEWDEKLLSDPSAFADGLLRGFVLDKPVVAAVNGDALAGGTELVLATDLRVAADGATLGLTEVARGLIPGAGGVSRLPQQVPYCKAMEILLLGEPVPVEEAWRIGLVNQVLPRPEVLPRARALAERIAANGPLAVQAVKQAVRRSNGLPLGEALAIETEVGGPVFGSKDAVEGPLAFMEKRQPHFTGT